MFSSDLSGLFFKLGGSGSGNIALLHGFKLFWWWASFWGSLLRLLVLDQCPGSLNPHRVRGDCSGNDSLQIRLGGFKYLAIACWGPILFRAACPWSGSTVFWLCHNYQLEIGFLVCDLHMRGAAVSRTNELQRIDPGGGVRAPSAPPAFCLPTSLPRFQAPGAAVASGCCLPRPYSGWYGSP